MGLQQLYRRVFWMPVILATTIAATGDFTNPESISNGPASWSERNLATIQKIYNLTVYPHNIPFLEQGDAAVPAGLFNEQATGRVSPVGNFSGFDDSVEYFFALAPDARVDPHVAFYDAEIVAFTTGCARVAASLVYLKSGTVDPTTAELNATAPTSTISQVAFWRFDAAGAVLKYEAWIPNLQAWNEAALGVDFADFSTAKSTALRLCPTIQQRCQGSNQQYDSVHDCVATLKTKPFGSFDEVWGDNIVCRIIHLILILTQIRPDVHCPHVGPVGGSPPDNYKCVDIDYSEEYFDDVRLFRAPEGDVFTCD